MSQPKVLIVDDEPGLLQLFASLVERMGYETLRANGGQAALDILMHTVPDVLVLDLAMPYISGMDVLRWLQDQRRLDTMSVVVLTALGFTPEMNTLEQRVDAWISRPVAPNDFVAAIRRVVNKRG